MKKNQDSKIDDHIDHSDEIRACMPGGHCYCSGKECVDENAYKSEIEAAKNKYLRALADYQNLEKRVESIKKDTELRSKIRILSSFLDILDHIEKAESFVSDDGLKMVAEQFRKTISELGLEEIDVLGKEYDPYTAEAIEIVAPEKGKKGNVVVKVLRKGYRLGDSVLRPAHVQVTN